MSQKKKNKRKKIKKILPLGKAQVKIQTNFSNTIINITDMKGNTIVCGSAGHVGFSGSRKSTAFAAQQIVKKVVLSAKEQGVQRVEVFVKGPGSGRESSIRFLKELGLEVLSITDNTPIPHNGCRPPKRPRG
ncbi:30S ribosomal protein S11 [Candidatus Phytoplasma palmae]|uniref:30S ribosomal protein S11 n=1 Tax=Candidatus Phytoplasma palmae TaxID=85624 RepID=UPI003990CE5D